MLWMKKRHINEAPMRRIDYINDQRLLYMWEHNQENPPAATWRHVDISDLHLRPCELRIILAPPDIPGSYTTPILDKIFHLLTIPEHFAHERQANVCYSFGKQTDSNGFCAWFHFLCKDAPIVTTSHNVKAIAPGSNATQKEFSHANYDFSTTGFFLRKHATRDEVTLVCFGASPQTRKALTDFIHSASHHVALAEPSAFFDIVIHSLFKDVDRNVWNVADVFTPLETGILNHAYSRYNNPEHAMPFAALHNISKHTIYLSEAIASQLLLISEVSTKIEEQSSPEQKSVYESLQYCKTLYQSTKLRLASLQRRVDNTIDLSFNLVTQQDSLTMITDSKRMLADSERMIVDSSTMKAIAALTMVFLPATAVATIMGNSLFDDGGRVTSQFYVMWYVVVPLTLVVFLCTYLWMRWMLQATPGPFRPVLTESQNEE